jgi:hypothetical protein
MVPLFLRLKVGNVARPERRLRVATGNQYAGFAQGIDLTAPDLWIRFRAADVGDQDRQVGACRLKACVFDQLQQLAGGFCRRAVTQHEVEQHDGGLRVVQLRENSLIAQRGIDHGMRTAAREIVIAHVDECVTRAVPDIFELAVRRNRRIRRRGETALLQ